MTCRRVRRDQGTILFVDDEAMLRDLSRDALEAFGFEVLTAEDGAEALEVFEAHRAHLTLVVMDMTMPVMDGLEALRRMKAIQPSVPVLLSSGYSEHDLTPLLEGGQPDGFLMKPFRIKDLEEAIRKATGSPPIP